ncbi:MAG: hypothetical protein OXG82_05580 [Gammaproteobacteria bacterium]|nr:hypothetical protein [Gammaproteobacteria bacterium]
MKPFRLVPARIRRAVSEFVRSARAAATLAGGVIVITGMAGVGGLMTNYAWHEAQWAELRAATRAAVAAAGPLLSGGDHDAIKARVAGFLNGLAPGLTVGPADVTVSHDAGTNETTIVVGGSYEFDDIWGDTGDEEQLGIEVEVRLEFERYEMAFALDVSPSMSGRLADGTVKLDALKAATHAVLDTLAARSAATPGSVVVSIVPYASAVNVADTCNRDSYTGLCVADQSKSKARYVRMLAGVRDTMADTLRDARNAKTAGIGGHWVDTFHHYGAGTALGPLRRQYLPDDLLADLDWDLRGADLEIDVSSLVPSLDKWVVDGEDFWNGCLMARWGAYWNTAARGPGWTQDHASNWPAKNAVAAWNTHAAALPATTPLHLSDAPPVAGSPSTLFTAYSWPDARIAGRSDGWLQDTMAELLDPDVVRGAPKVHVNDWSLAGNGGGLRCPDSPITPMTETTRTGVLRGAVDALETVPFYEDDFGSRAGATYQHLGIVWALRTLSPLWQGVWGVHDASGALRPGAPCAPGETVGCIASLQKSIILVADGASFVGSPGTQLQDSTGADSRPVNDREYGCTVDKDNYHGAAAAADATSFNGFFRSPTVAADLVDADGRLNDAGRQAFVDAFIKFTNRPDPNGFYGYPTPPPDTAHRRVAMMDALASASLEGASAVPPTPWELFRGLDADVVGKLVAESEFGFDGRPTVIHHGCRVSTPFGPYGRADDLVYVGDVGAGGVDPSPIAGVAPFDFDALRFVFVEAADGRGASPESQVVAAAKERLDEWLRQACRIVGARGVRIHAVYIGWQYSSLGSLLEDCVDAAGGDPDEQDVYVVPSAAELTAAFNDIVTVRRNLRFLD